MQTSLLKTPPPSTLPVDCGYYVPALQNRPGELEALEQAPPEIWEKIVPLMHCVGQKKRTEPISAAAVKSWLKRIAAAVGSHPFYLDILRLRPNFPVRTSAAEMPVLQEMYAAARSRGLCFIPVAWVGESSKAHLNMVASAAIEDGNGVALRYRFREFAIGPGVTQSGYLAGCLDDLGSDVADADLLLDLGYLDPETEIDAGDIRALLDEATKVGEWRSIVLLGSSTPQSLGCVKEGTIGEIARREWELWSELLAGEPPRMPAYGDYAVQHPRPPMDPGGPGMRANIRYTADGRMLVARGEGLVIQEGKEQYRELCQWLTQSPDFAGNSYSWGDQTIGACAAGTSEPGWQDVWRGAGTSHHLAVVVSQLPPSPAPL
jgi:Beta protein